MQTTLRCPRHVPSMAIATVTSLWLAGCEAPLNLEAVQATASQATRRTDFYQAMARNPSVIVVAGNDGVLLSSRDDGQTWTRHTDLSDSSFLAIDTCPDQSFVALTFDNHVWHGNASANQWVPTPLPSQEQMMTVACSPEGNWVAAGSFTTIQYSSDQGQSWQEISLYEDAILNNLQFLDQNQAIATGEYGLVLASDDGGEHWAIAGHAPDDFYIHTSHFTSPQEGWVGGLNGFIYHTRDGARSWTRVPVQTSAPVFGFVPGDDTLYALADNATVLKLEDGVWVQVSQSDRPIYLKSGLLLPNQRLLVAGGHGLLFALKPAMTETTGNL